ncbi:MAG: NAD(P)-dependent oxidoreductase [candidate division NC10 bacterium]|nr:NAD(P)-dependent oxidoreductase [candidate division NC10 bacterium]
MVGSIGFLGPGLMGRGIVKNLLGKGYKVMVHAHREGMKLEDLLGAGASVTRSLTEVAEKNGTIMLCVPSSKEVEAAILGSPGLLQSLREGSVVVDLSTSLPASTRMLAARLRERNIAMLDAPMTGTPTHANAGELNLMIGGEKAVYEKCLPIFRAIAKNIIYVGATGHGNIVKLINNFLGQLSNAGIAEVLPLAAKAGVDLKALYDVVRVSGGNSRVFEGSVPAICRRDFTVTFHLKLAHKDMSYMSAVGREYNLPLPMVNSLLNVLDVAKASGLADENASALVKLWERVAQVEVRRDGVGQ